MRDRMTPPPDLTKCDDDEKVERMVKWFFENFEDAAERTPYETAEGGYQYIWGGPYDARETLEEVFTNVADDLIHRAAAKIEDDGDDWVPVPHEDDYK